MSTLHTKENLSKLREKIASFKSEDFGESFGDIFKSPFPHPPVYPKAGMHPRVMVHKGELDRIRKNLSKPQNRSAYESYLRFSEQEMTGEYTGNTFELLTRIEAKAFRYLITGDEKYGLEAIYNIKNAILTVENIEMDPYRAYGLTMYVTACVYDWCYGLLTDKDKTEIINGAVNELARRFEVGCPPKKEGAIAHHTVECQILRSYYSFAISVFDECPDVYEYVAGRLYSDIVPAQNLMLATGKHWEGAYYAPFRFCNLMDAEFLTLAMTEGKTGMFDSKSLHTVANAFMDFTLPGLTYDKIHVFELGDVAARTFLDYFSSCFFSAAMFDDAALKGFSYNYFHHATDFDRTIDNTYVSAVRYLILNNPDLAPTDPFEGRELVRIAGYPCSTIFARSAWGDKDAVAVYMTMPEFYSASHSHAEAGSFQIYYKGMLASDSGYYTSHGIGHHSAYTRQTISANSILVYNPNLKEKGSWGKGLINEHPYCGGQSLVQDDTRIICPYTIEQAKTSAAWDQLTLLGKKAGIENGKYLFSYLAGDMTKAYDKESVDEVTRHILSVMTDDEKVPMVLATYDRVTAKDPSYKKTVLLHSMTKPVVNDGALIITNTKDNNSGKLVAQSLLTDMDLTVYGDGDGEEYTINGVSYKPDSYDPSDPDYRIELSPKVEAKTDKMLTIMYVTDADNDSDVIKPVTIETDALAGVLILNRALLFAKNENLIGSPLSFSTEGASKITYYVAGVKSGEWQIALDGKVILKKSADDGIISFTADAGEICLTLL